eukprot:8544691-Pyramimonas_sp.AAC.1
MPLWRSAARRARRARRWADRKAATVRLLCANLGLTATQALAIEKGAVSVLKLVNSNGGGRRPLCKGSR